MKHLLPIAAIGLCASVAQADTITEPFAGVTLEQLYDSNVMNARGQDAVTRVTPRVGFVVETRRLELGADYRLGLHAYATGTAASTINHRGSLGTTWRATPRLGLHASAVMVMGDDPVLLDRPGVAIPQGGFFDLVAEVGMDWRATRRVDLGLDVMHRSSRFDLAQGPSPLAFDGDEQRVDANAAYRLSRRWTTRLIGRYQHFVSYGGTGALGDAIGGGAGAELKLSERTRARAYGGAVFFVGSIPGWFAGADVTRIGQRWRLALRAFHDIYGGTSAAEAVWFDSLLVDGTFKLSKRIDLRVRAGGYRGGVAPNYDMNVTGLIAHGHLGWSLNRNARLELYGEHRAQDAGGGIAFGDVQRTVAGLRLTTVIGTELSSIGELP